MGPTLASKTGSYTHPQAEDWRRLPAQATMKRGPAFPARALPAVLVPAVLVRAVLVRAVLVLAVLVSGSLLVPTTARAASPAAEAAAMRKFDRAQRAFDAKRYDKALGLFKQVANVLSSPNAMFMAGRCLRRLERLGEAFEAMSATVELANERANDDASYLETRDAAAAQREALAAKIGRVVVAPAEQLAGLEVRVGERVIPREKWGRQFAVEPGTVLVSAEAPGHQPFARELELAAGDLETVAISLKSDQDSDSDPGGGAGLRTAGIIGLALGAAGVGAFAVAGLMANDRFATLQDECKQAPCKDPRYREVIEEGETLDLVANVGIGVGAAGLVAGATLLLLGRQSEQPPAAGLSVQVHSQGASLGYALTF